MKKAREKVPKTRDLEDKSRVLSILSREEAIHSYGKANRNVGFRPTILLYCSSFAKSHTRDPFPPRDSQNCRPDPRSGLVALFATPFKGVGGGSRFLPRPSTEAAESTTKFWSRSTFEGTRVYQRDDIFDVNFVSSWKEAGKTVTGTNLERMASGRAPIGYDGESVVLHHMLQTDTSPLAEMTTTFHRANFSRIHINPNAFGSGINRPEFNAYRSRYWAERVRELSAQ